jgi:hypothetical protein
LAPPLQGAGVTGSGPALTPHTTPTVDLRGTLGAGGATPQVNSAPHVNSDGHVSDTVLPEPQPFSQPITTPGDAAAEVEAAMARGVAFAPAQRRRR